MTDASATSASTSTTSNTIPCAVSKPRLSLTSKQAGIQLSSEDIHDEVSAKVLTNFLEPLKELNCDASNLIQDRNKQTVDVNYIDPENVPREILMQNLLKLDKQVQQQNAALTILKCERFRKLINPIEISRSSLANTYIQLQDRIKQSYKNKNSGGDILETIGEQTDSESNSNNQKNSDIDESENFYILNALLEMIDRHPLLTLPRDSIYFLDYETCEESSKNYLNFKVNELHALIDQYRKYRYYMNEKLKQVEKKYLNLAIEYEQEKNAWLDKQRQFYSCGGRVILLNHIEQLKNECNKEQEKSQHLVITLLNLILDEQETNQKLSTRLSSIETENSLLKDKVKQLESLISTNKVNSLTNTAQTPVSKTTSVNRTRNTPTTDVSSNKSTPSLASSPKTSSALSTRTTSSSPSVTPKTSSTRAIIATTNVNTPRLAGFSNNEPGPVPKIQSLFKSSSISSSSPQVVKNKLSSSSVSMDQQQTSQLRSLTSSTRFPVKPQVPAKPAQLLEQQQRNT